jgi:L-threonylcarbamoyladenylate synthase
MYNWSINPRVVYAARQIRRGGVVAYPTEAVWGLGCDPFNEEAVERILELKQRPIEKGVILIAASIDMFAPLLDPLDDLQRQRLKNSWPGPHTWLVPHHGMVPPWRQPYHACTVRRLCRRRATQRASRRRELFFKFIVIFITS